MKKIAAILLSAACAFSLAGCGSGTTSVKLGTGGTGGNYYAYGNVLANLVNENLENTEMTVKTTAGSAANLRLLKDGYIQMAIVQNDILYDAVNGMNEFVDDKAENIEAVAALYTEALQLVVPADSDIKEVTDLKGKKVSVGEEDSAVIRNAKQLINAAGIREDQIEMSNLSFSDSAAALANGEIDAFFVMAGAPTVAVTELCKEMDIRLVPLDDSTMDILLNLYPQYTKTTIPAGTYEGQEEDVTTVGAKAVLVTDSKVSDATVKSVTELLFDHADDFKYATSVNAGPDTTFATEGVSAAFHSGALSYYSENGVTIDDTASEMD